MPVIKRNIQTIWFVVFISVVSFSCKQKEDSYKGYYNIDSLIQAQINYLPTIKVSLLKKAGINKNIDSVVIAQTDTILWSKELEVFRQLNVINRPIYAHSYSIENLSDSKSNLTVRIFKPNKKLPVEYLKIYYHGSISNLKKIEAYYHEDNLLYGSSRKLSMEFETIYSKITLVNYSVAGKQKMFLGDSSTFFITGSVEIN